MRSMLCIDSTTLTHPSFIFSSSILIFGLPPTTGVGQGRAPRRPDEAHPLRQGPQGRRHHRIVQHRRDRLPRRDDYQGQEGAGSGSGGCRRSRTGGRRIVVGPSSGGCCCTCRRRCIDRIGGCCPGTGRRVGGRGIPGRDGRQSDRHGLPRGRGQGLPPRVGGQSRRCCGGEQIVPSLLFEFVLVMIILSLIHSACNTNVYYSSSLSSDSSS